MSCLPIHIQTVASSYPPVRASQTVLVGPRKLEIARAGAAAGTHGCSPALPDSSSTNRVAPAAHRNHELSGEAPHTLPQGAELLRGERKGPKVGCDGRWRDSDVHSNSAGISRLMAGTPSRSPCRRTRRTPPAPVLSEYLVGAWTSSSQRRAWCKRFAKTHSSPAELHLLTPWRRPQRQEKAETIADNCSTGGCPLASWFAAEAFS